MIQRKLKAGLFYLRRPASISARALLRLWPESLIEQNEPSGVEAIAECLKDALFDIAKVREIAFDRKIDIDRAAGHQTAAETNIAGVETRLLREVVTRAILIANRCAVLRCAGAS